MLNPSQEPPASSEAQNENLKDLDALCTCDLPFMDPVMTNFQLPLNTVFPTASELQCLGYMHGVPNFWG